MDINVLFDDPSTPALTRAPPSTQGPGISTAQVLSRLDAEEETVYMLTRREGAGLQVTAYTGTQAWATFLTPRDLETMATEVGLATDEFTRETERALAGRQLSSENFVFSVSRDATGLRLAWKRHLLADNVKFQLGSVLLRSKKAGPAFTVVMEHAVSATRGLQDRIMQLERENSRLIQEREKALTRLEQSVQLKEQVEEELYSKFKMVLNEKKGKIRRLMAGLGTQQSSEVSPTPRAREGGTGGEATGGDGDDAEQHDSDQTDDELHSPSPRQPTSPQPSTSSGLLGEAQEVVSPPVKRRKREPRHRGAGGPDIPRPPSIIRPPSTDKVKVHVERSRSGSSVEGEDLLQLL